MDTGAGHRRGEGVTTPQGFWNRYKQELVASHPTLTVYRSNRLWTAFTKEAAEKVMSPALEATSEPEDGILHTSSEYFRVDIIGEQQLGRFNWLLKIAFEHENYQSWEQEFCKLTHVVADLRVLAAYHDFTKHKQIDSVLQERVDLMQRHGNRITRVPKSNWLFIFGPSKKSIEKKYAFRAFTLDGTIVKELADNGAPLKPGDWDK